MAARLGGRPLMYDQLAQKRSSNDIDHLMSHLYDYMPFSRDGYNAPITDWNEARGFFVNVFTSQAPALISNQAHNAKSSYLQVIVPVLRSNVQEVTVNMEDVMITPFDRVSLEGIPHMGGKRVTQHGYSADNFKRSYEINLRALADPEQGGHRLEQLLINFTNDYNMTLGMNVAGSLVLRAMMNINEKAAELPESAHHSFLAEEYEDAFLEAVSNPSELLGRIGRLNNNDIGLNTLICPKDWFQVMKKELGNAERYKYKQPEGTEEISELVRAIQAYQGNDYLGNYPIGGGTPWTLYETPTFKVWSDDTEDATLNAFLMPYVLGEIIMGPLLHPAVPSGDPFELDITVVSVAKKMAKYMRISLVEALKKSRGCYFYGNDGQPNKMYEAFVAEMNRSDNIHRYMRYFDKQNNGIYDPNQESDDLIQQRPAALNQMEEFRGLCPLVGVQQPLDGRNAEFIVPQVVSQFPESGLSTKHMLRISRGLAKVMQDEGICTDQAVYDFLNTLFPKNGVHINAFQVCLQRVMENCDTKSVGVDTQFSLDDAAKATIMGLMFYYAVKYIRNGDHTSKSIEDLIIAFQTVHPDVALTKIADETTISVETANALKEAYARQLAKGLHGKKSDDITPAFISNLATNMESLFKIPSDLILAIFKMLFSKRPNITNTYPSNSDILSTLNLAKSQTLRGKRFSVPNLLAGLNVAKLTTDNLLTLIKTGKPERNTLNLVPLQSNINFSAPYGILEEVPAYSSLNSYNEETLDQYRGRITRSFLLQSQDKETLQLLSSIPDQAFESFVDVSYGIQSHPKVSKSSANYYNHYAAQLKSTSDTARQGYLKRLADEFANPSSKSGNLKPKVSVLEHNTTASDIAYTSNIRDSAAQRLNDLESMQSFSHAPEPTYESYGNFLLGDGVSTASREAPNDWSEEWDNAFKARFEKVNSIVKSNEGYAMCAFIALCYAKNHLDTHLNLAKYGMCLFVTSYIRNAQRFITQMLLAMRAGKETAFQTIGDSIMTVDQHGIEQHVVFTNEIKHNTVFENHHRLVGIPNAVPYEFIGGRDTKIVSDVQYMGTIDHGSLIPIFTPVEETNYEYPLHLFDAEIYVKPKHRARNAGTFLHRCSGMHYLMFLHGSDKVETDMAAINKDPDTPWQLRLPFSVILHRSCAAYYDSQSKGFKKLIEGSGPLGKYQMNIPSFLPAAYTRHGKGVPANNDLPSEIFPEA